MSRVNVSLPSTSRARNPSPWEHWTTILRADNTPAPPLFPHPLCPSFGGPCYTQGQFHVQTRGALHCKDEESNRWQGHNGHRVLSAGCVVEHRPERESSIMDEGPQHLLEHAPLKISSSKLCLRAVHHCFSAKAQATYAPCTENPEKVGHWATQESAPAGLTVNGGQGLHVRLPAGE